MAREGFALRLFYHLLGDGCFAVISAAVPSATTKENQYRRCRLRDELQQDGHGWVDLAGSCSAAARESLRLPSSFRNPFLVLNLTPDAAKRIGARLDQSTVVAGRKGRLGTLTVTTGEYGNPVGVLDSLPAIRDRLGEELKLYYGNLAMASSALDPDRARRKRARLALQYARRGFPEAGDAMLIDREVEGDPRLRLQRHGFDDVSALDRPGFATPSFGVYNTRVNGPIPGSLLAAYLPLGQPETQATADEQQWHEKAMA